jgi:hypothetical protein
MDPLIALTLDRSPRIYRGGDTVRIEYQIDAIDPEEIQAIEASILWFTEGKGEPDMGVHFFRRSTPDDVELRDMRPLQRLDVVLPQTPLSYDGVILKIRWCVRIRLFLSKGREYLEEQGFQLGDIPPGVPIGPTPRASAGAMGENKREEEVDE